MPLTSHEISFGQIRNRISHNRQPFVRVPQFQVCESGNPVCTPDQAVWVNGFLADLVDFDPDDFDL